jgi:hypothetical protein
MVIKGLGELGYSVLPSCPAFIEWSSWNVS